MSDTSNGRFVWYECLTTDPGAASAFYSELFGWRIEEVDMGPAGTYRMIHAGEVGIGGIAPVDPGQKIPPSWLGYVSVPDVDRTVEAATAKGASVPVPAMDIPNVGRFAIVADPTGGHLAPFTSSRGDGVPPARPPVGHFCWRELLTHDLERARSFYPDVYGWDIEAMDMGPAGTYWILSAGGVQEAGIMQMPAEAQAPTHWMYYVHVENVDESAERLKKLGGQLYVQPRDIPSIGRFAVGADPVGASFALFKGSSG